MPTHLNKTDPTATIHIEKIVYQGWGLGRHQGLTVFVPKALPGDVVTVKLNKKKRRYAMGHILNIDKPSALRLPPPCVHSKHCGGCQLLDLSYSDQLTLKEAMFDDAFRLLKQRHTLPKRAAIMPSESPFYYRNKMEYAFAKTEAGIVLGLKERQSYKNIVPTPKCMLLSPDSHAIMAHCCAFLTKQNCSVWDHDTHTGLLRYLVIRHSKTENTFQLTFVLSEDQQNLIKALAKTLTAAFPNISGIFLGINNAQGDAAFSPDMHHIYGARHLNETFENVRFRISPQSFFQTNTRQGEKLYQRIRDLADLSPTKTVLDLYCGTGTIGLFLAAKANAIYGIEENAAAVADAKENAKRNNIGNASFTCGRVKNILKFEQPKADVVIVDPPRSGMVPKALRRTLDVQADTLIYVSCNPTTLVRDLEIILEANYTVDSIDIVDMFPNTYHMESIVKLRKT